MYFEEVQSAEGGGRNMTSIVVSGTGCPKVCHSDVYTELKTVKAQKAQEETLAAWLYSLK